MKFRAVLQLGGKTATGLAVPADIVTSLGAGKRPKVRVTIKGYIYRSSVAMMGGVFMLPVSEEVRHHAGVAAGDAVDVDIELDTEPRVVSVPPDFAAALDADAPSKRYFEGLSYSHQLRLLLAIEQAKTAETRQRRLEKTISTLREGQA